VHRVRTLAAVSNGVAAELRRHYPAARVVTTANGVDTDRYRPDAVLRDDVRRREGVQPTELVSLFVGGDWNHKGLAVAILGIGELERASVCDVRLWVVGRGDEERLRRLARSCGVEARVRFFGQQADPRPFYQAADLFLMPSRYEAFSLAMLEAAASGLPLVTTPVNGTAELVGDDAGGIIIERSPAAVAAAIARLRSEPSLRARMGAAARERSLPYGWGESIDSILDEYDRRLGSIPGIDR
jgi:UDP-glucose:(heptosyl)LPS alpha-1,3-glucosyltransferase